MIWLELWWARLVKEVDFLGVSLLCSGRSVNEVLEIALCVLDLR